MNVLLAAVSRRHQVASEPEPEPDTAPSEELVPSNTVSLTAFMRSAPTEEKQL